MKAPVIDVIRTANSRLKVQCRIYPTKRAMLLAIRRDTVGGIANSTLACCMHQTKSTIMDDAIAAVVFLSRTHLDADTIAHEMVHAARNVLERRRRTIEKARDVFEAEELLATTVGELVGAFKKKFIV